MLVAILLFLLSIALLGAGIWFLGPLTMALIMAWTVLGVTFGVIVPLVLVQLPGIGDRVGRMLRSSAASTLDRPTISFGDSTDLVLRRRTWNTELAREIIPGGDDETVIENPGSAVHAWHGRPLMLVDEWFGVAFDQRHAAVGERLQGHILEGTLILGAIRKWLKGEERTAVPAYSEIPKAARRVDLEGVWSLFWGAEEGDHPDYAEEIFKKSQAGRVSGSRARQMLLPFAALLVTYGMMWVGAQYGPSSGGGGGGGIVPIGGTLWLLLSLPRRPKPLAWIRNRRRQRRETRERAEKEDEDASGSGGGLLRRLLGYLATLLFLAGFAGITYLLYLFFGPLVAALMTVGFIFGAAMFPFGGFLLWWRFPRGIAEAIAKHYLRFGLMPFDDPVFRLSTDGQDVVDGATNDVGGDTRYRLATRWVGFDLDPESLEELFSGLYETPSEIEARQPEALADGGMTFQKGQQKTKQDTADAPPGYVASPSLEVEGVQGYVPKKPDGDVLYVRNDKAMSPFQYAQQGGRIYKAIEVAKEKFGAGWQALTDRWVYILTVVFAVLGLAFGLFSFHL